MKQDIFTKKVSYFKNVSDTTPEKEITLREALNYNMQPLIEKYRETGAKADKLKLPCFTPSGTCTIRKDSDIAHNGVVCIDIDEKDNKHITNLGELKKYIHHIPYVAYCGLSVGGKGFFILIPIQHPQKHKEQYLSICDDFERCNIKVDRSCINASRLRFVSHDSEPYINEKATLYVRFYQSEIIKAKSPLKIGLISDADKANIKKCIDYMSGELINMADSYEDWFAIGCSLASGLGEEGREYFHAVSSMSEKYDCSEADKKYNECLKADHSHIGRFFNICKKYNIEYKKL